MMKKFRLLTNTVLSAIIVALGFGSCVSAKQYKAAQEEIESLKQQNEVLQGQNADLQKRIQQMSGDQYRQKMEERKVVYGPRPTPFNPDADK